MVFMLCLTQPQNLDFLNLILDALSFAAHLLIILLPHLLANMSSPGISARIQGRLNGIFMPSGIKRTVAEIIELQRAGRVSSIASAHSHHTRAYHNVTVRPSIQRLHNLDICRMHRLLQGTSTRDRN